MESICLLRRLLVPQLASAKIKGQLCYNPEKATFKNWAQTQRVSRALIARQGRNLNCEYFYRSLGCQAVDVIQL